MSPMVALWLPYLVTAASAPVSAATRVRPIAFPARLRVPREPTVGVATARSLGGCDDLVLGLTSRHRHDGRTGAGRLKHVQLVTDLTQHGRELHAEGIADRRQQFRRRFLLAALDFG